MDVLCVGETLVDFLPESPGLPVKDVPRWTRCSGGSPANVAVGVARLGGRSAMLGVVGRDEFGDFLRESLAGEGVDVTHLRQTDEGKTGLVFISLSATGERSFAFYRTRAAELFLSMRDVDVGFVRQARAIHCGTNSLLFPEAREAAIALIRAARDGGQIACCDPNLRLHLWPDPRELQQVLRELLPCCSVVKLAEDEVAFATGQATPEGGLRSLAELGVALPVVTLGERGAVLAFNGQQIHVPSPRAQVVDTTGAGDGFVAALLHGLTRLYPGRAALERAAPEEIRELAAFACRAASRVVERVGPVAGLPRAEEVAPWIPAALRRSAAQGAGDAGQNPEDGAQAR
jgi:fructokinase